MEPASPSFDLASDPTTLSLGRALLVGHFSTVGDLECLEYVKRVLDRQGCFYDIAAFGGRVCKAIPGALTLAAIEPERYSQLIVICGPCWPEFLEKKKFAFDRFGHCNLIGVNLTMVKPLSEWNPFDTLLERDSDAAARPDLAFLMESKRVPVVGRCIIRSQNEYGDRQRHEHALAAIDSVIARWKLPVIDIDTRWPSDQSLSGPEACSAVNALIGRVDVLLTNRLHGLVFAIRNGVPALAIDGIAGGDKVTSQARTIGWSMCLRAEEATSDAMDAALTWCLRPEAKEAALRSRELAVELLGDIDDELSAAVTRKAKRDSRRREEPQGLLKAINSALRRYRV